MWPKAILNTVLIAYLFILLEWSFYVTQASISFMYAMTFGEKLIIYMICGLLAAVLATAVVVVFGLIDLAAAAIFPAVKNYIVTFPGSFLLSIFFLTLADNFTYTIFKFGLSTANLVERIGYLIVFLVLNFFLLRAMARPAKAIKWFNLGAVVVVAAASLVLAGGQYFSSAAEPAQQVDVSKASTSLPNIILFGTDGVSADSTSLYGGPREDTPNLEELAKTSLVSENNFTNAGHSMGSDVALLTSKSPLETGVLYPPDILQGSDVDESLPNILKSMGYETDQLAIPHYADSDVANIEGAFDSVNCAENSQFLYGINRLFRFRLNDEFYMLNSILGDAKSRLLDVLLIEKRDNPIADIEDLSQYPASDKERMSCLFTDIDRAKSSNTPLFVHVHMLTTHGSLFYPDNKTFSGGMIQTANWMDEFYADSILDYDAYVKELVDYLKADGEYDNTVIVIYTDHGEQWTSDRRIPLMFHFPNDEYAGTISQNTQNMDIAPTLLDYLGVDEPSWMSGSSVLEPLSPNRLIVSTYTKLIEGDDSGLWGVNGVLLQPPFYEFSVIRAIECQKMVTVDVDSKSVNTAVVANYVNPCDAATLDSQDEIQEKLGQMLTQYGFDLPAWW